MVWLCAVRYGVMRCGKVGLGKAGLVSRVWVLFGKAGCGEARQGNQQRKEGKMIYTVTVISGINKIRFGFNHFSDMTKFLETVTETVDGFEEGKTSILVAREEENPTEGSL